MKVRVPTKWNPLADGFQLTKQEIESQVLSDLSSYRQKYQGKYNKPAPTPLDVDNFVSELWGFSISFESVPQDDENETLGFIRPEKQQVVVDENILNQKRISFTIGHEAGHLSLHGPLFKKEDGIITGWSYIPDSKNKKKLEAAEIRREWQANVYAGALLATEIDIKIFLEELGLVSNSILLNFNLNEYFEKFESRFGLSRQALEIRLQHLRISFQGAKYNYV